MSAIRIETTINRTPSEVWAYVRDISSHVEWMADAASITFKTDQTEGVGTKFDCLTKVGPLKTVDTMTITSWEPEQLMGVSHDGAVSGVGQFVLSPLSESSTLFVWEETLTFPLWFGGSLGSVVAKPVLKAIWRRNLKILKSNLEAPSGVSPK